MTNQKMGECVCVFFFHVVIKMLLEISIPFGSDSFYQCEMKICTHTQKWEKQTVNVARFARQLSLYDFGNELPMLLFLLLLLLFICAKL